MILLRIIFLLVPFCILPANILVYAFQTEPHPLDTFLDNILDFREPTGIRGILRYVDVDEETIWLDWEQRSDARPLFMTDWKFVPGEPTLAIHPSNPMQFQKIRQLPKGTSLELIIKDNGKGHRYILSFHDQSTSPKVPL